MVQIALYLWLFYIPFYNNRFQLYIFIHYLVFHSKGDYYIQIERTSATAFKAYVRTGSYSGTILASITNGVTTSAIGGLQYIKIQNRVTNNSPSPRLTIKEVGLLDGFSEWA